MHLPLGYSLAHLFADADRPDKTKVLHLQTEKEMQEGGNREGELKDMVEGCEGVDEKEDDIFM